MKKIVSSVALALIAMALNGCGGSNVPECDSTEATDVLKKLVKQGLYEGGKSYSNYSNSGGSSAYELGAKMGAQMAANMANQQLKEALNKADIFFDGFTTSNTNEKNRSASCRAKATLTSDDEELSVMTTYNVQYSDDKSQIYVELVSLD